MHKKARLLLVVALVPAIAVGAYAARWLWDHWLMGVPVSTHVRTIDLGEREAGEVAIGKFQICNAGGRVLILDGFKTTCTCAGIERVDAGQHRPVEYVEVMPGDAIELTVRVGVIAPHGYSQVVNVFFNTNDLTRPTGRIQVVIPRVKRGVYADPTAVLFGTVAVGSDARQVITLYDTGRTVRRVKYVRSTRPDRFEVRLLPVLEKEALTARPQTASRPIACVEVIARTAQPARLDGEIEVQLEEAQRPDVVPVMGVVAHHATCWPSVLVLPRRLGQQDLYSGEVLVINRHGQPIDVEIKSAPSGLVVAVRSVVDRRDQRVLEVHWDAGEAGARLPATEARIILHVRSNEEVAELKLPVLLVRRPS